MEPNPRHAGALTRRGALALGAAAGVASLAQSGAAPLDALAAPRRRAFDFAPEAFGRRGISGALRVAGGFVLVGLHDPLGAGANLDVRTRRDGERWGPWTRLGAHATHGPDAGRRPRASDPVWTGRADELQLRASRHPGRPVRIEVVSVSRAAHVIAGARASAAARAAQLSAGPAIVPRADWGGDRVIPRASPSYGTVEVAFVHHTDGGNDYGPDDSAAIVLAIAKYHRDTKRWNDVGYNFLVDRYGRIFEGRAGGTELPVIGAHAQGYNSRSTGIAILGAFSNEPATEQALDAVARLLGWKLPIHGSPVLGTQVVVSAGGATNRYRYGTKVALQRINGHRDGDSTACPGNALYAQLPELRARAAKLAITPVATGARVGLAAPKAIGYGELAAFSGSVLSVEGAPQPGVPVRIQKQGPGGGWVTIARTTTAADGGFQASAAWRRVGQVRAAALEVTSAPLTVGLLPKLDARLERAQITAGGRLVARGTVRPAERVTVIIERRSAGRWSRVAAPATPVASTGFTLRRRITRPGTYRVIVRAAHAGSAIRSAPLALTVTPRPGAGVGGTAAY